MRGRESGGGGGGYKYGTFSAALHVLMFCVCPCRAIIIYIIYMLSNVHICVRGSVCVLHVWNFQCCFACFVIATATCFYVVYKWPVCAQCLKQT